MRTFRILGQVVDRRTGRGTAGLRVEAWDKDTRFHDLLGVQHTDTQGRFTLSFDERYFGDYGGDELPDLFFKVFHGDTLLLSTENSVRWNSAVGEIPVLLSVNAPSDVPLSSPVSEEVGLHELGESVAQAMHNVQRELMRYPDATGAFVLDDMELTIPVRMRTDELGQLKATVTGTEQAGSVIGQVRLRMRPVSDARPKVTPVPAEQQLDSLGVLKPEAIQKLEMQRIFSVGDLMRVAQTSGGRAALGRMDLGASLDTVLGRVGVLSLPQVPPAVRKTLLELGVQSPTEFTRLEASQVAARLSKKLQQSIPSEWVHAWQRAASPAAVLELPLKQGGGDSKD